MFYFLHSLEERLAYNETKINIENGYLYFESALNEQKKLAQSIAYTLSEDNEIKKALAENRSDDCYKILYEKMKNIRETLNIYDFLVQIHSKELKSFVRSWDKNGSGVALDGFREGLGIVRETKKGVSGIELGRKLNIKAIVPIFGNNGYIGSIEAIFDFLELEKNLLKLGIRPIFLLDSSFLDIALDEAQKPKIGNYTLINSICEKGCLKELGELFVDSDEVIYGREYAFGFRTLYSYNGKIIGKMGISIQKSQKIQRTISAQHEYGEPQNNKQPTTKGVKIE